VKASKWPRLIASGLVHVLVAALLVGCVASGDNSAESRNTTGAGTIGQTLDYWLWVDNATDPTWQQLADAFNAEGGHGKVQLQFLPSAQYLDKLQVALASGSGPDAARMKDEWMGAFASAGALAPLSNRINWLFTNQGVGPR
jgi:multiple sugar transport system substrate-binding protein